jgi:formate-dependent nitrite reductase cytochrome c552 subunit
MAAFFNFKKTINFPTISKTEFRWKLWKLDVDSDNASDNKISGLVIKKHLLSITQRLVQHIYPGRSPARNVVNIFSEVWCE